MEGFWPKESRENPRGKARFPLRDYSPAFPGCEASGLAAFSGRARSTAAASLAVSSKQQRDVAFSSQQAIFASAGSREVTSLVGCGATPRRYVNGNFHSRCSNRSLAPVSGPTVEKYRPKRELSYLPESSTLYLPEEAWDRCKRNASSVISKAVFPSKAEIG